MEIRFFILYPLFFSNKAIQHAENNASHTHRRNDLLEPNVPIPVIKQLLCGQKYAEAEIRHIRCQQNQYKSKYKERQNLLASFFSFATLQLHNISG